MKPNELKTFSDSSQVKYTQRMFELKSVYEFKKDQSIRIVEVGKSGFRPPISRFHLLFEPRGHFGFTPKITFISLPLLQINKVLSMADALGAIFKNVDEHVDSP